MKTAPGPRTAPLGVATALAVVAVITATLVSGSQSSLLSTAVPEIAARARAAEDRMRAAERFIRDARARDGVVSEGADGSIGSSLVGSELTPLTTTLGNLEAKRLATEPAWAGALVARLHEAGLRRGDVVAAGFSGSFPGLNLAVTVACQALGLRLAAVTSVTSSSWGANQSGYTWPEIDVRLVDAGLLPSSSVAVTAGGEGDRALDLDPEGRAQAERIARAVASRLRVPFLLPAGFQESVQRRLEVYTQASAGRPIRLYVNVGGAEASLGRSPMVLRLRNGFLPGVPFDFSGDRGVLARFAERGVRVLTLLNVRDLAMRWGIL